MNSEKFNKIVSDRCDKIVSILASKGEEYGAEDRLHNFKVASRISNTSPELALKGMMMKHIVSVFDLINDAEQGKTPTDYLIQEKIGDSINYLILLEALLTERLENADILPDEKCECGKPAMYIRDSIHYCSDCHALYLEAEIIRMRRGATIVEEPEKTQNIYILLKNFGKYKKGDEMSDFWGLCEGVKNDKTKKIIKFTDKK